MMNKISADASVHQSICGQIVTCRLYLGWFWPIPQQAKANHNAVIENYYTCRSVWNWHYWIVLIFLQPFPFRNKFTAAKQIISARKSLSYIFYLNLQHFIAASDDINGSTSSIIHVHALQRKIALAPVPLWPRQVAQRIFDDTVSRNFLPCSDGSINWSRSSIR